MLCYVNQQIKNVHFKAKNIIKTYIFIYFNIPSTISYPDVALRKHCTIVDHLYNQTIISVIISKHYNQCCFKVKKLKISISLS